MSKLFFGCTFVQYDDSMNISSLDTSSVTTIKYMFLDCTSFNQPLHTWKPSFFSLCCVSVLWFCVVLAKSRKLVYTMDSQWNIITRFQRRAKTNKQNETKVLLKVNLLLCNRLNLFLRNTFETIFFFLFVVFLFCVVLVKSPSWYNPWVTVEI